MSNIGLYTSGAGALGQASKVDVIADNLANVATTGFRRASVSFRARMDQALGAPVIDAVRAGTEAGPLEPTGRPLDFALRGDGLFDVREVATGRRYHTRAGNFRLDALGHLVTADGRCRVLSDEGREIRLDPARAGRVALGDRGLLTQGGRPIARLGVTAFDDATRLERRGATLLENAGNAAGARTPAGIEIAQGTLEGSSVNPVAEMVDLIAAMRAMETNLQMIRIHDQALDRAVNDLGRVKGQG